MSRVWFLLPAILNAEKTSGGNGNEKVLCEKKLD